MGGGDSAFGLMAFFCGYVRDTQWKDVDTRYDEARASTLCYDDVSIRCEVGVGVGLEGVHEEPGVDFFTELVTL